MGIEDERTQSASLFTKPNHLHYQGSVKVCPKLEYFDNFEFWVIKTAQKDLNYEPLGRFRGSKGTNKRNALFYKPT